MSALTQLLGPLYTIIGYVLALIYKLIPNYTVSIALITVVFLVPFTPLVAKTVKSQAKMQKIQPELKRLNEMYKTDPQKRNEATMELFKREGVNPAGGCLPMLPQMVVLIVFYSVIRGLTHFTGGKNSVPRPLYIPTNSTLFENIKKGSGHLYSFGMDLSTKITAHHGGFGSSLPYWAILILGGVLQYLQVQRMTGRMPQTAQLNAQAQFVTQKILPLAFLIFYLVLPTGVCIYYLTSTIIRIFQYEWIYFRHPGLLVGDVDAPPRPIFGAVVIKSNKEDGDLLKSDESDEDKSVSKNHPRSKQKKQRKRR